MITALAARERMQLSTFHGRSIQGLKLPEPQFVDTKWPNQSKATGFGFVDWTFINFSLSNMFNSKTESYKAWSIFDSSRPPVVSLQDLHRISWGFEQEDDARWKRLHFWLDTIRCSSWSCPLMVCEDGVPYDKILYSCMSKDVYLHDCYSDIMHKYAFDLHLFLYV